MNGAKLPIVADAAAFEAWLVRAGAGERCVYAQGPTLPRFAACAVLARGWAEAGLVTLVAQRADGQFNYIAQKRVIATPAPVAGSARAQNRFDESPQTSMLRLISRRANFGMAAPTLRELADYAGFDDSPAGHSATRRALDALVDRHELVIENSGGLRRFVLKGGRATGWLDMRAGIKAKGGAR